MALIWASAITSKSSLPAQAARLSRILSGGLAVWLLLVFAPAQAEQIYQTPEAFLAETFGETSPEQKVLWVTGELRKKATDILQHRPKSLRSRYWEAGGKTAWMMDELGKERDISFGVVITDNRIVAAKVLVYRENRGYEITSQAFSEQFTEATLRADHRLDRHIDGITGATLSVNAMKRIAALALLYHQHAKNP